MNPNTDFIPFARPCFSKEEEDAVLRVVRSGWLTTGSVTAEFEKKTAERAKTAHALAVNSATSGLHLALDASSIEAGDWVITSPYTFTATAEVVRYSGAHPVFADIESDSYNISPEKIVEILERKGPGRRLPAGAKIKAVIPVHIGGELCKRNEINSIAVTDGLSVVEDGAHLQPGPLLNDDNNILVYSFYATKCLATGEGGMIVTNNENAAAKMKKMRFHGIDREAWDRYRKSGNNSWEYDVMAPGYKYNLPDIASSIGIVQLEKMEWMRKRRVEIADQYNKSFGDCDFLTLPPLSPSGSRHLYILRLNPEKLTIDRNMMINELSKKGIGTSVHYKPLHLMSYYKKKYSLKAEDYPESLEKYQQSFSLPLYPDLTEDEISRIIKAVLETGKKYYRSL